MNDKQTKFVISKDWKEGIEYGWESAIGWAPNEELRTTEESKQFVRKELPKLLEDFYQSIIDKLSKTMHSGYAIEICEEYIASNLEAIILELAGAIDKSLITEYK